MKNKSKKFLTYKYVLYSEIGLCHIWYIIILCVIDFMFGYRNTKFEFNKLGKQYEGVFIYQIIYYY